MKEAEDKKSREYTVARIKNELINLTLLIFSIIAIPAVFGSLIRIKDIGVRPIMYLHLLIVSLIIGITIVRKRLPFKFKANFVISVLFLVGVGGILNFGLNGNGIPFLFSTAVFATIFYDRKAGIFNLIVSIGIVITFALLVKTGKLSFDLDFEKYNYALTSWITYLFSFIFLGGVVVVMLGRFNRYLLDLVINLEERVEDSTQELRKANQAKSEFLANMSHEIRTPMNGVLGMLRMLSKSSLTEEQKHKLFLARSSAESLLSLINDILDFSKAEAGKIELEKIDFNLRRLFEEVAEASAIKAQKSGVEVVLDLVDIDTTMVKGDPGRIRQIVTNLVGNAVKFTKKGEILIKAELLRNSDGYLTLVGHIQDSGIGISPENIDNLFSVFTQADSSTTRKFGGTGLGLSICYMLTELMDGGISVRSVPGKGSSFEFNVRLEESHKAKPVISRFDTSNISILVIEKNSVALEAIVKQLKAWGIRCFGVSFDSEINLPSESSFVSWNKGLSQDDIAGVFVGGVSEEDEKVLYSALQNQCESKRLRLVRMSKFSELGLLKESTPEIYIGEFPKPATTKDLFNALRLLLSKGQLEKTITDAAALNEKVTICDEYHSDSGDMESINIDLIKSSALAKGQFHILVVEDNFVNQQVIQGILEEFEISCAIAENGLDAIRSLAEDENTFSLVLMDCQMPEMDGYQATREIRAGKAGSVAKNITIVAMTANAMQGDKEKCIEAGMNDYLSKPIDPVRLVEVLYQQLIESGAIINKERCVVENNQSSECFNDCADSAEHGKLAVTASENIKESEKMTDLVWDKENALKRLMGKESLLKRLCGSFIDSLDECFNNLKDAISANDADAIRLHAHTLKGTASNVGGVRLQALAAKLEHGAKEGEIGDASLLVEQMERASEELQVELKAFLD